MPAALPARSAGRREGLAFWRADLPGHPAVEHQGVIFGFNSQIFLAPDDGVGVLAFTNGSRNASTWLTGETERLLGDLIGAPHRNIRTDVPQHPKIRGDICGWYRPRAQRTDMQARTMLGAEAEVGIRRGHLMVRTLGRDWTRGHTCPSIPPPEQRTGA